MTDSPVPLLGRLLEGSDRPVITLAGRPVTAATLLTDAQAVAGRITGLGCVAVFARPDLDTVVGVLAGLLAGVPVVPVPADSGPAEVGYLITDSGAELLLDSDAHPDCPVPVTGVRALTGAGAGAGPEPAAENPALIVYTSGTTGRPKGAVLSRAAVAAGLDALAEAWGWTPDDTLVHGLPLFHVHGLVLGVLGALRVGSPLVHVGSVSPTAYGSVPGSMYFAVPTLWSRLLREPGQAAALRGARLLVSGSAALPVPVFEGVHALTGHHPLERYGMTETLITLGNPLAGPRRAGWVGHPMPGVTTRLVDEHGHPVPHDGQTPGELCVRGPMLFDGYLNRPDATAQALDADGWMHTGDIAVIEGDWHRIVGRASTDLISSGGYRIGAGEVENALLAHPGVAEAAVLGLPHPDLGEQVVAYVVADGVGEDELVDFVAGQLSRHKRPRQIRFVAALPRNAMGKIVKSELREP